MDSSKPEAMTEEEFRHFVESLLDEANIHINDRIRPSREEAWRKYYGQVDAKPVNGGCDIVVRTIQDATGSIIPELMDIFTSADMMCEFLPNTTDPMEATFAKAASLAVSNTFWSANGGGGWLATYDACSEAIISGYGFYKVFLVEKYTDVYTEEFMTPDELMASIESKSDKKVKPLFDPDNTPDDHPMMHMYGVTTPTLVKELAIEAVPASNMTWLYASDLCESWLVGQATEVRIGDLVAMGFTPEELKDVRSKDREMSKIRTEENARENYIASNQSKNSYGNSTGSWAAMKVMYYELHVKADKDGDGKPEHYKVWVAGDNKNIIRYQKSRYEDMPFIQVPAYRIPHSTYSESIADRLNEFQEAETRIQRAEIDLAEMISGPMILNATGNGVKTNALARWKANKVIDCRSPDGVKWLLPPDVGNSLLQTAQEIKMRREDRSGVSRIGSSLRPEDMADVQATVAQAASASSEKKIAQLARLQAELAIKPLMSRVLMLLIEAGTINVEYQGRTFRLNTENFKTNWKVRVKVGLGTGTRVERAATMFSLWTALSQVCMQMGQDNPITDVGKLRNLVEDFAQMQPGVISSRYVKSMDESEKALAAAAQQPPPPDPALEKVKQDGQIAQQKLQNTHDIQQQKIQSHDQIAQQKLQVNAATQSQKLNDHQQAAMAKLQAQMEQDQAKMRMEYEQKTAEYHARMIETLGQASQDVHEHNVDTALELHKIELEHEVALTKIEADKAAKVAAAKAKPKLRAS